MQSEKRLHYNKVVELLRENLSNIQGEVWFSPFFGGKMCKPVRLAPEMAVEWFRAFYDNVKGFANYTFTSHNDETIHRISFIRNPLSENKSSPAGTTLVYLTSSG